MLLAVSSNTQLLVSSIVGASALLIAIASLRFNVRKGFVENIVAELSIMNQKLDRCERENTAKDVRIAVLEDRTKTQNDAIKALEDKQFDYMNRILDLQRQLKQ